MAAKPQAVPEPDSIAELDELGGRTRTILVGRHSVEVRELSLRDIVKSWKTIAPALNGMAAGLTLPQLLAEHEGAMYEVLSIATAREPEWLARVPLRKQGELLLALVEVNADGFMVGVQLRELLTSQMGLGSGLTPSSSSDDPASATPTD